MAGGSVKTPLVARTQWSFIVMEGVKGHEFHILWKDTRNSLGLYTQNKRDGPFGRIVKLRIATAETKDKETVKLYYLTNNLGVTLRFKCSTFNPFLVGSQSSFARKLVELRPTVGDEGLTKLISAIIHSPGFRDYDPNIYGDNGCKLSEKSNMDLDNFSHLRLEAMASASKINAGANKVEVVASIAKSTSRKIKDSSDKANQPQNKQQKIEKFFAKEKYDEAGIECEFLNSLKSRVDISLDNLTVSNLIQEPLDVAKITKIAISMTELLDLTQLYFIAIPLDPNSFDENDMENQKYQVINGRHRLSALIKLKDENKLAQLPFLIEKVPCLIFGSMSIASAKWAHLRCSDIAARFVYSPNLHDLAYEVNGLKNVIADNEDVVKTSVRFCNLLKKSDSEKAALKAFSKCPQDIADIIVKILMDYERYKTADVDDKLVAKSSRLLMQCKKLIMPVVLFKRLVGTPPEFLREHHCKILSCEISVKDFVGIYVDRIKLQKKEALVEKFADFKPINQLRIEYPNKFDVEVLNKLSDVTPPKSSSTTSNVDNVFKRPLSDLEFYTRNVIRKTEESNALCIIEHHQAISELKGLISRAKSPLVLRELDNVMKKFENYITASKVLAVSKEYEFNDSENENANMANESGYLSFYGDNLNVV